MKPRSRRFVAQRFGVSEVDALLLVVVGGVVVPACLGDEFAPALGSMLFIDDEKWWCLLWCDRASAVLAKLSAATARVATPRYFMIIFCSSNRLLKNKSGG